MLSFYYNSSFLQINEIMIPSIKGSNTVNFNVFESSIYYNDTYTNVAGSVQYTANYMSNGPTFENIQLYIDKCNWICGTTAHQLDPIFPLGSILNFQTTSAKGIFKDKKIILYTLDNGGRRIDII